MRFCVVCTYVVQRTGLCEYVCDGLLGSRSRGCMRVTVTCELRGRDTAYRYRGAQGNTTCFSLTDCFLSNSFCACAATRIVGIILHQAKPAPNTSHSSRVSLGTHRHTHMRTPLTEPHVTHPIPALSLTKTSNKAFNPTDTATDPNHTPQAKHPDNMLHVSMAWPRAAELKHGLCVFP